MFLGSRFDSAKPPNCQAKDAEGELALYSTFGWV